ncbi:GNAT domain-containing protein [Xylaria palmicola]|nr:GNAT domain-containing protein [Xylaria palmicola]
MACTALGQADADLAATQAKLDPFLPPRETATYNPAICLAATGELIGLGGVFHADPAAGELGWPEVGYMIRSEHWGKGYATEFLRAFVPAWFALPRARVTARVDARSAPGGHAEAGDEVPEMLCAMVEDTNVGSLRVMEKAGFRRFKTWTEVSWRPGEEGTEVTLVGFVHGGPRAKRY